MDDNKNIWQAVRYLRKSGSGFAPILRLKNESTNKEVTNGKEIAATLLSSFFSPLSSHPIPNLSLLSPQLQMQPIIEEDIWLAIFTGSLYSIGSIDNLP